jgi:hypothetical protein
VSSCKRVKKEKHYESREGGVGPCETHLDLLPVLITLGSYRPSEAGNPTCSGAAGTNS